MELSKLPDDAIIEKRDEHLRNIQSLLRMVRKERVLLTDGSFVASHRRCGRPTCKCAKSAEHLHLQIRFSHHIGGKAFSETVNSAWRFNKLYAGVKLYREICHELEDVIACAHWIAQKSVSSDRQRSSRWTDNELSNARRAMAYLKSGERVFYRSSIGTGYES